MSDDKKKTYLGDGLYAWDDGYHIVLATDSNTVYLDGHVLRDFFTFLEHTRNWNIRITKREPE